MNDTEYYRWLEEQGEDPEVLHEMKEIDEQERDPREDADIQNRVRAFMQKKEEATHEEIARLNKDLPF